MPGWIIAAALASVAATALLAWVLWRSNEQHLRRRDDAGAPPRDSTGGQ